MDNNVISFEQIQKYFDELETLLSNPISIEKIEVDTLENLRPKMHWVQKSTSYTPAARFYCSNCGNDEMYKTPFCPMCGAMEIKE